MPNQQDQNNLFRSGDQGQKAEITTMKPSESDGHQIVLKPITTKNISSLLPEPIRLPKAVGSSSQLRPKTEHHSGALLNLPPLIVSKPSTPAIATRGGESEAELVSVTTSGVFADTEDNTGTSIRDFERRMSMVNEDIAQDAKRKVSKTD